MRTGTNRPMWTRGVARIEGDKIILDAKKARPYALFEEPEQHERLLMDLAELRLLGSIVNQRIINKRMRKRALVLLAGRRFPSARHGSTGREFFHLGVHVSS